jgi:transcriptional regulator with XRE-family HTH domain
VTAVALTLLDRGIAERILAARIAAKLTPWELARAAHLDALAIGHIEDAHRPATPAEVAAIAGALGMSPDELTAGALC